MRPNTVFKWKSEKGKGISEKRQKDKGKVRRWMWKVKWKNPVALQVKNLGFPKGVLLLSKRSPFTLQKESFYSSKGVLLFGSSDLWSDTIVLISANCRRLWRPRRSLSKLVVQFINNKNARTNCTDYGGDAIASYCFLCQLTYRIGLITLSFEISD